MFPIGDDNPTLRRPVATYAIVLITVASWVWLEGAGRDAMRLLESVCNLGMIPGEVTRQAPVGSGFEIVRDSGLFCLVDDQAINILTPLTSMFLHGGWLHLLGNMLFLWIFGNNVEDVMGRGRFVVFYVLSGLAAALAHILVEPSSVVPTVGASGAISGVMGAYLVLYPHAHVRLFFPPMWLPAWLVLIVWFGLQIFRGLEPVIVTGPEVSGGVAFWAHVGGFIGGALLVNLFRNERLVTAHREAREAGLFRYRWQRRG